MFPKKNRADKAIITQIFAKSSFVKSVNITAKFLFDEKHLTPRISFIVPKPTAKSAVERNLLRRRGYNVLDKYINNLPHGFRGVFIFNKESPKYFGKNIKFKNAKQNLENEIKKILDKIN